MRASLVILIVNVMIMFSHHLIEVKAMPQLDRPRVLYTQNWMVQSQGVAVSLEEISITEMCYEEMQ